MVEGSGRLSSISDQIYAYIREIEDVKWVIILNVSEEEAEFSWPEDLDFSKNN